MTLMNRQAICASCEVDFSSKGFIHLYLIPMQIAARNGHLQCLKAAHEKEPYLTPLKLNHLLTNACRSGNLGCIRYISDLGAVWHPWALNCTVRSGSLDCVMFAHENGQSVKNDYILDLAARSGSVDIMRYLYENGAEWSRKTAFYAASAGFVECLQYAHENDAPWLSNIMQASADNIECLRYVYENGGRLDADALHSAASNDNLECIEFMVERSCPFDRNLECVRRNRTTVAQGMSRRRSAQIIQKGWRVAREASRRRAVSVIEDAFITWSCRPGTGNWFKRSSESFGCTLVPVPVPQATLHDSGDEPLPKRRCTYHQVEEIGAVVSPSLDATT